MIEVKNIKLQMYGGLAGAAVAFVLSSSMFRFAKKYTKSSYYYWSRDASDVVAIMNVIGIFFLLIGVVLLGEGLVAVILKNSGKFCPDCKKVYFKSAVMRPRCKTDLRYAKSVKEYLAEKPRILSKGIAGTCNGQSIVQPSGICKRFCTYCGKGLSAEAVFCPHCGNKIN